MSLRRLALLLVAVAGVGIACRDQVSRAQSFESTSIQKESFTIDFPQGWVQPNGEPRRTSSDALLIASSAARVQGVGLARGDADIIVEKVEGQELSRAFDAVGRLAIPDEEVVSSRNLPATAGAEPDCDAPAEVVTLGEIGPGATMTNTYLLCRRGGTRFLVLLRYWRGERRAEEYRRIAYDVARSVRLVSAET